MRQKSHFFVSEPHWFDARYSFNYAVSYAIRQWLFESGSLTQRLRDLCGAELHVRLLKQVWQKPFLGESHQLELPVCRYALIREVALCCGEMPLVCARTIIPLQTLRGAQRRLSNLGTRPLGEVLFSTPKLERNGFELAEVAGTIWNRKCFSECPDEAVWGRRTIYSIGGRELLVSEFFLPALLEMGKSS